MRDCLASHPAYVYSVGSSLVLVDVSIDDRHPDVIRAWPRVVLSDRGRVQALAAHVKRALVYFSDTDTGAVYRMNRDEWDVAELTVQQPHVEGKTVHLLTDRHVPNHILGRRGKGKKIYYGQRTTFGGTAA